MPKIVLSDTAGGFDISSINDNFQAIQDELNNKVLYRDNPVGEDNELTSNIDVNGKVLYNLPAPSLPSQAARLQDIINAVAGIIPASFIPFAPYLDITSTNVQDAIEEVKDDIEAVKDALQLASYTALRNYTGDRKAVLVTGYFVTTAPTGVAGLFVKDDSDTTSADNGGTIIVATNGKRWKRQFYGPAPVEWFGAVGNGTSDDLVAIQSALTAGSVLFVTGKTYYLSGSVNVPGNRKIIVEKNSRINSDGRFTSYNVSDVHYINDGVISASAGMPIVPALVGLPQTSNGTQNGDERGFIEFVGSSESTLLAEGFTFTGSGKVMAGWAGTPNFDDPVNQVNRKGIAIWNASKVYVGNMEVTGFEGEAVYARAVNNVFTDVVFENLHVHHCRFNGPNFNGINVGPGWKMLNNRIHHVFQGIEMSVGDAIDNRIEDIIASGIFFGVGAGTGPMRVARNTIARAALSVYAAFNNTTGASKIEIESNHSIDPSQNAFLLVNLKNFTFKNNTSTGHAQTASGYAFNYSDCSDGVAEGNTCLTPGAFSSGVRIVTSCNDVTFGIDHTPTNTSAAPKYWYDEGFFNPVPVGLSVVNGTGAITTSGTYTRVGRLIYWQILVTPLGTATSAAGLVSTTFTGLPFTAMAATPCHAATGEIVTLPNGLVSGTTVFPPAWAATNFQVTISGVYATNE